MAEQPGLVPITRERHGSKKWRRYTNYQFAARMPLVPIVAAEITAAVYALPLAFVKEGDRYLLASVLSLMPDRNMFVGPNGEWLGSYTPSILRAYPFRMLRQDGTDTLFLAVDETTGLVPDDGSGDEAFFDEAGNPSDAIKVVLGFLNQIETSRKYTDLAVSALGDAGVLKPWPLKVETGSGPQNVDGLYHVDESAMAALPDDAFGPLRGAGALPIAYAQLFSMSNINMFPRLAQIQAQLAPKPATPENVLKSFDSVDPFFGLSAHDNLIKF